MPPSPSLREIGRTADSFRYALTLPRGHGYFDGHFPGDPILPGVSQLQLLTTALGDSLQREVSWREVQYVRFRQPIRPDEPCELSATRPDADGRVDFRIEAGDSLLTDGRIVVHAVDDRAEGAHG